MDSERIIDIDMLLLGKTGNGKSATGNSILLRNVFISANNCASETADIKSEWSKYTDKDKRKYDLKVTDGPGLDDTSLNKMQDRKRAYKNIAQVLSECPEGVHAFLVVLRMGHRFTEEERKALQSLKEILGKDFLSKFGVVVVTGGDDLNGDVKPGQDPQTFEDWCSRQKGEFQAVRKECDNRCVLFDNRTMDETKRREQLDTLLEIVREIISRNNGERYTNETFNKLKISHRKLMRECNLTMIKEEFRKQLSILGGEVQKIAKKGDVGSAIELLNTLLGQVEFEVKETPRLDALKQDLVILKTLIEEAGGLIEKGQSAADVLKKATVQCSKMIKAASPPTQPSWFEKLCAYVGFPATFVGVPLVAALGGPVGLAVAGMLGGTAAAVGGIHAISSKNAEYRY